MHALICVTLSKINQITKLTRLVVAADSDNTLLADKLVEDRRFDFVGNILAANYNREAGVATSLDFWAVEYEYNKWERRSIYSAK